MTDTGELTIALPDRAQFTRQLAVATRFLAAVSWVGVVAMLSVISNGLVFVLLGAPLIITAAALWARRAPGSKPHRVRHSAADQGPLPRLFRSKPSTSVMIPLYYAAILAWVGAAFLAFSELSAIVLIAFPLIITFVAYASNKRLKTINTTSPSA